MSFISKVFILSGIYAVLGIYFVKKLIFLYSYGEMGINLLPINLFEILLFAIAVLIAFISTLTTFIIIRKNKVKISLKKRLHFMMPLLIGFLVLFFLIHKNYNELIVPFAIFIYGISLLSFNRFSIYKVIYLGIALIVLGILSFVLNSNGLLFLTLGFGIFPIIFGLIHLRKPAI